MKELTIMNKTTFTSFRKTLARMVEIGAADDFFSRGYDFLITGVILVNLAAVMLDTFPGIHAAHERLLKTIEAVTALCFLVDYVLRLVAARFTHPRGSEARSVAAYVFSFGGLVDLLSFLPNYLPVFFPAGAVAFRLFRVVRIFRLFRITAYYDSLNAIAEVIGSKKQQLISSVFIILVLILASSLCMYSVESDVEGSGFTNAFSGVWWAVSTLLTVGYGDIVPTTTLGKVLGAVLTFLGVGMVAIPTGIISAGFVEQYARIQASIDRAREQDILFIKFRLNEHDDWAGRTVASLKLPLDVILTAVHRGHEVLVPNGSLVLQPGDTIVLGAEPVLDRMKIDLKEIVLLEKNPWNGRLIRDLDLSRQTMIVMVKRGSRTIIPKGSTRLQAGDKLLLHTKDTSVGESS
jgi:voltage-gated potassium channel